MHPRRRPVRRDPRSGLFAPAVLLIGLAVAPVGGAEGMPGKGHLIGALLIPGCVTRRGMPRDARPLGARTHRRRGAGRRPRWAEGRVTPAPNMG
jgi:hypothetical protein